MLALNTVGLHFINSLHCKIILKTHNIPYVLTFGMFCKVVAYFVFISPQSAAYVAVEALRFCVVRPGLCPRGFGPIPILLLHKNTELISMKFAGGNHYNEHIK